jgi:hypothetical protein
MIVSLSLVLHRHGHVDHCFGIFAFDDEHREKGWPLATVVGHRNVGKRFNRYKLTLGYNSVINSRQFGTVFRWPETYRYPDTTYEVCSQ